MKIEEKIDKYLNEKTTFTEEIKEQIEYFLFDMEQYNKVDVEGGDEESTTAWIDGTLLFLYWDPEYKKGGMTVEYDDKIIGEVYSLKEFKDLLKKKNIKLK